MQKWEDREPVVLENEGQKIFAVLHTPCTVERAPVVLFFHGFGGNKCGKYRLYVNLASALSKKGIASLRLDFRGSGDSEGELTDMTLYGQINDAIKGLEFLETHPKFDPNRIGIFGRSLGGAIAVMVARRFNHAKSLALWAPLFSGNQWKDRWEIAQKKIKQNIPHEEALIFNGHVASKEFFVEFFQINLENDLKALSSKAFLHIHSTEDQVVSIEHAEEFRRCREHASGETRFITFTHSDHDFSFLQEQKQAIAETADWFKNTL